MTRHRLSAALLAAALALGAGCDKKDSAPGGAPPSAPGKGMPPAGAGNPNDPPGVALFRTKGCASCHTTPQTGPARKGNAPDLSKVAADPAHTRDWLIGYVRDPHGQNPQSKMPSFAGKLNEDEMGQVADFLLTLK